MARTGYRTVKDSMGEMEVPKDAYYAAQTARAIDNFPVSGVGLPKEFIKAMALISPPLEKYHIDQLKQCTKPKIVISGNSDNLIPPENVYLLFREAAEPKQLEIIPGADHFLFGFETGIAATAANFILASLKSA